MFALSVQMFCLCFSVDLVSIFWLHDSVQCFIHAYHFRSFPNSIMKSKADRKRVFIADEIEECKDHSSIYFSTPAEKGYIG